MSVDKHISGKRKMSMICVMIDLCRKWAAASYGMDKLWSPGAPDELLPTMRLHLPIMITETVSRYSYSSYY